MDRWAAHVGLLASAGSQQTLKTMPRRCRSLDGDHDEVKALMITLGELEDDGHDDVEALKVITTKLKP